MASSLDLTDSMENVFQCSICGDEFEEPKLLPCLHRFCENCLDQIIQASTEGTLKCPICKKTCEVSTDGVSGFKTDFHMKSRLEFLQLQKSLNSKDSKECGICSKKLKISIYCFKCEEFLCDQCGQFHENNRLFRDHSQDIFKLENYEEKDLLEKMATVTQTPRCRRHVEQEAMLCCSTCGNQPVCVSCLCGAHKGHDVNDVVESSESERESLKMKLDGINQQKDKLYNLPKKINKSMTKLKQNESSKSERIKLQYEQQLEAIEDKMTEAKTEREKNRENIKTRRENELNDKRRKHEEDMKQVEDKYDQQFNETDETYHQIIKELERKRERLDSYLKELTDEKEKKVKQNETELQSVLDYAEQIIKRYENFTATASSILASNDKWADVQCIPDIRAASEVLLEEMNKEFPELDSLLNFKIDNLRKVLVDVVTINEKYESFIDVEGFQADGLTVCSVTYVSDDIMAITGGASEGYAHITAIKRDGKIQRQDKMKRSDNWCPLRYCCRLSESKVATVCQKYEVGVYDVRDGSYNFRNSKEAISNNRYVTCVTTDSVKNQVIVGTTGREVYVFDHQLNYVKTVKLPDKANYQRAISVHEGNLLVCANGSAYVVTLGESSSQVMHEFPKPDFYGCKDLLSLSVCTDKNGFIYMLWRPLIRDNFECILVHYSQDSRQILAQIPVYENASCITTAEQDGEELVVVATREGHLYTFRLIVK